MKKLLVTSSLLPFILLLGFTVCHGLSLQNQNLTVDGHSVQLKVPEGTRIDFLAKMHGPRFLTIGPDKEFLFGSKRADIYRLKLPYTEPETLVTLSGRNHSVAYRNNKIIVAETAGLYIASYSGIHSFPSRDDFSLLTPLPYQTGGHWSRTVVNGPDQKLYIGLGISGNCSDEYLDNSYPFERRRGGVYVLNESGASTQLQPYASGLRNPIGLTFHPDTDILYATNAGPDNLGFNQPPEIFTALSNRSYHGMPWFQYYNGRFRSGLCATSSPPRPASDASKPMVTFAARSTPEGITFVTRSVLGPEFTNNALIAIHGSWAIPTGGNNASKRPPKIAMVSFSGGKPTGVVSDIVTGFQRADGSRFARPCGIIMGPDGNIYFTSDGGEVTGLFRLSRENISEKPGKAVAPPNFLLLR